MTSMSAQLEESRRTIRGCGFVIILSAILNGMILAIGCALWEMTR